MISFQSAIALATLLLATVNVQAAPTSTTSYLPQASPKWLPSFPAQKNVITSWPPKNAKAALPSGPLSTESFDLTGYPPMNEIVTNAATDPNIIPIMKAINWAKVPSAPVTSQSYADKYPGSDPYCWWYDISLHELAIFFSV